jgi:hypothetical protein
MNCRSLGRGFAPRPMSGTPVITHRSCPNNWLVQFSLTNVHKGGPKQHSFNLIFIGRERAVSLLCCKHRILVNLDKSNL